MSDKVRLLIADDHTVMRNGLAAMFGHDDGVEIVAIACNGTDAAEEAVRTQPDVALIDLSMPEVDGVEATRRIRAGSPGTRVVILTAFAETEKVLDALAAGACGYLLKDADPEEIIRGVAAAGAGHSPFSPQAASALLTLAARKTTAASLSPRELEVLTLVVEGLPNKQIARRLTISEKTVKAHLTNVFARIGVLDRTQAALWAVRNGIVAS
jgi:DNA-binding NarL/FixJ family response regulator